MSALPVLRAREEEEMPAGGEKRRGRGRIGEIAVAARASQNACLALALISFLPVASMCVVF